MALRARLRRLMRGFPAGRWCECPTEQVVVRYRDDAEPSDDAPGAGRVCLDCGLPRRPGPDARVVINMPCRRADATPA